MGNKIKIIIDVGNTLAKIGYQYNGEWFIDSFVSRPLAVDKIQNWLKKVNENFEIEKIFLGSVVAPATKKLTYMFQKNNYKYHVLTQIDFRNQLPIEPDINIEEVGIDILGAAYYIRERNDSLCFNFGTATVAIHFTNKLSGAIIGYNFIESMNKFCENVGLPNDMIEHTKFGKNTEQAITGFQDYIVNGFINKILSDHKKIKNIYVTGGYSQIFDFFRYNADRYNVFKIDNIVIKGYYKLTLVL